MALSLQPMFVQRYITQGLAKTTTDCQNFSQISLDGLKEELLDFSTFIEIIGPPRLLVERALQGSLAIPDFADFSRRVELMFREASSNRDGMQPDYIAPLKEWDPDLFGLAVVSVDGQTLKLGDTDTDFPCSRCVNRSTIALPLRNSVPIGYMSTNSFYIIPVVIKMNCIHHAKYTCCVSCGLQF